MTEYNADSGLISVVIPAYNAEKTIRRCIESVLAQTYQKFEIIIVDDGSTDGTGKICKEYIEDKRILYIWQENGGEGAARNTGLDHINGDFVTFLDSDDTIPENTLQVFSNCRMYDFAVGGLCTHYGDRIEVSVPPSVKEYSGEAIKEAVLDRDTFQYLGGIASKVFKTEIIQRNGIRFNKNKVGADTDFVYRFYAKAERICIIRDVLYDYYIIGNSMSHGIVEEPWKAMCELYVTVVKEFGFQCDSFESFIILMRSIKPTLLYAIRAGKTEFLRICKQVYESLERMQLNQLHYSTNAYENAVYHLLVKNHFNTLYLMLKARTLLLPR